MGPTQIGGSLLRAGVGQTDARTQPPWLRTARVSHRRANLEPDPGLANHLLWLVNFGCSNDVKQESRSSPIGVGYHPSTKNNGDSVEANVGPS
jgi:hypothetical protein